MHGLALHDYIVAALFSAVLMVCHYLSPYLKRVPGLDPRRITSFAGGVAVGYVFLHMLPELVESHDKIHQLLDKVGVMTQFKDLVVFLVALLGFEVFYFMERYATSVQQGAAHDHRRAFRVHLLLYFIYNFLMTYTMFVRIQTGIFYTILFIIAIGMHFVLTDNHFKRYFPSLFNARSHMILIGGLLVGYVASFLMYPMSVYFTAVLTSFLSGSILYNSFAEEIPMNHKTSLLFFFLGTFIMGGLLAVQLVG